MARWITGEIREMLEKAVGDRLRGVVVVGPGGDHDTEVVILDFGREGRLWVRGFDPDQVLWDNSPGDVKVELVEVSDGRDSRGGLNSEGEDICVGYGLATAALRRAGFSVVASMDGYF